MSDALSLVRAVYARHGVGCCLHAVLDDGNVDDDSVEFCLDFAKRNLSGECTDTAQCVQLGTILTSMSEDERAGLLDQWEAA